MTKNSTQQACFGGLTLGIWLCVDSSSHSLRQILRRGIMSRGRFRAGLWDFCYSWSGCGAHSSPVPAYDLLTASYFSIRWSVFIFLYGEEITALPSGLGSSLISHGLKLFWTSRLLYSKGTHGSMFKQFILKMTSVVAVRSNNYCCLIVIYHHRAKHTAHISHSLHN